MIPQNAPWSQFHQAAWPVVAHQSRLTTTHLAQSESWLMAIGIVARICRSTEQQEAGDVIG